jgi:hypothetical protein
MIDKKKYYDAKYECELPDSLNINNNIIDIYILKRKTTIGNEIVMKIKEVIKNARTKS